MKVKHAWQIGVLALIPVAAFAGTPTPLPEPGVIELLATAGVVAAVIALRKRRK